VSRELLRKLLPEELHRIRALLGEDAWNAGRYDEAARLFDDITAGDHYVEFLTLPGYERLEQPIRTPVTA